MIDKDGYRANVGVILSNRRKQLFWGRRIGQDTWQFPQGGIQASETPIETLYRELREEIGLDASDVEILAQTQDWHYYKIPSHMLRHYHQPLCIGQKQKWFLLRLNNADQKIRLDLSDTPEFDSWCWVKYWYPVHHVIRFKREVYRHVLEEFEPIMFGKEVRR